MKTKAEIVFEKTAGMKDMYNEVAKYLQGYTDGLINSEMYQNMATKLNKGIKYVKDIPHIKPIALGAAGVAGAAGLGVLASKAAKTRAAQLAAQKRKDLALKALLAAGGLGAGYAASEFM